MGAWTWMVSPTAKGAEVHSAMGCALSRGGSWTAEKRITIRAIIDRQTVELGQDLDAGPKSYALGGVADIDLWRPMTLASRGPGTSGGALWPTVAQQRSVGPIDELLMQNAAAPRGIPL